MVIYFYYYYDFFRYRYFFFYIWCLLLLVSSLLFLCFYIYLKGFVRSDSSCYRYINIMIMMILGDIEKLNSIRDIENI